MLVFIVFMCLWAVSPGSSELQWSVNLPGTTVMEADPPPAPSFSGTAPSLSAGIAAMKGETEHRVIVGRLPSGAEAITNISMSFSNWSAVRPKMRTGSGDVARLSWREQGYVDCQPYGYHMPRGHGWYPDPLLEPLAGGAVLRPAITTSLWVSVAVSPTSPVGNYTSRVVLSTASGVVLLTLLLELEVWPITLPSIDQSHFSNIISYSNLPLVTNQTAVYEFMCDHRTPPTAIYGTSPRSHSDYRFMGGSECGGGSHWLNLGDLPFVGGGGRKTRYSTADIAKKIAALEPTVEWLRAQGKLNRAFVYGFDEQPASMEPAIRQLFGGIKAKWPTMRTMAVLNWPSMPADLPLDVWVRAIQPQYSQKVSWENASAAAWRAAGDSHETWDYWCCCYNYTSCLNNFVEWPPLQSRQMPWLSLGHGSSGLLYFDANRWLPHSEDGHTHRKPMRRINGTARTDFDPNCYGKSNGDGCYFWPSENGTPISSSRYECLRDGLEDVELLKMLQAHDLPVDDLWQAVARSPAEKTTDPKVVDATRREAAHRLIRARASFEQGSDGVDTELS